ncbi:hypothetical protein C8R45DRAFT_1217288 [Mycena sanguinolenta]|nr:hypothetical protein C8R45DRAFT_1217288 [Mycena sanguinolenta]
MRPSLLSTFTSRIEIERKFHPTRILLNALTRLTPTAPNPSLPASIAEIIPADVHFVRDVYYDKPDGRFVKAGVWVRKRSLFFPPNLFGPNWSLFPEKDTETSAWEAKVRVGGDFAASQFVEVQGAEAVEEELLRVLGRASGRVDLDKSDRDLEVMCDLTTRCGRGSWPACGFAPHGRFLGTFADREYDRIYQYIYTFLNFFTYFLHSYYFVLTLLLFPQFCIQISLQACKKL